MILSIDELRIGARNVQLLLIHRMKSISLRGICFPKELFRVFNFPRKHPCHDFNTSVVNYKKHRGWNRMGNKANSDREHENHSKAKNKRRINFRTTGSDDGEGKRRKNIYRVLSYRLARIYVSIASCSDTPAYILLQLRTHIHPHTRMCSCKDTRVFHLLGTRVHVYTLRGCTGTSAGKVAASFCFHRARLARCSQHRCLQTAFIGFIGSVSLPVCSSGETQE